MKRFRVRKAALAVVLAAAAFVAVVVWPSNDGDDDRGSPLTGGEEPVLDIGQGITGALGLEPGRTQGDDAVARLREEGYLVFDYLVCSDDVERGRLVLVRTTFTGEVVLDAGGTHRSDERSDVVDVLISDGRSCR